MANQHGSSSPIHEAMTRRLYRRSAVAGRIVLPAVPSMVDDHVTMCGNVFADVGRAFTPDELHQLKQILHRQLTEAFVKSPRSSIVVSYNAPVASLLSYEVSIDWSSLEETYENWVKNRKPPLFGTEPDARVWALAAETDAPATHPVLDIGAGTGRNALALARRGHPVDVVELTPTFAEQIAHEAERDSLPIRVIQGDVFTSTSELRDDYQLILLSEVLSDFRSLQQVRGIFELAARTLAPGGQLVFNVFVAKPFYTPDGAAREFGQQCYTSIFTDAELSMAADELPLTMVSDDSVYEYEKAHLPAEAWPPTSWYVEWVSGQDVFDLKRDDSPIEMRWRVYRKN